MAFSDALRIKIDADYRGTEFSQKDFHAIAISHGMSVKSIGVALRYLENRGIITPVRTMPRSNGGMPHKIYRVVDGAELLKLPRCNPGIRAISTSEAKLIECCNRINQSLNMAWHKRVEL